MKRKQSKNILIVDDISSNITSLAEILKSSCKIRVANTGKKAIEIAMSETQPDIILLDILMPEMDGYEVCRILKENPQTKDIPIIFITASNDVEEEIKGLELGAIDYIIKPFNPELVKIRVMNHLELKLYRDLLKENSMIDGLTNIYNKRKFNIALETEWKRARRLNTPLSVIIFDIDKFKIYNDTYGHLQGDECLKTIGRELDNFFHRPADLIARWGGEEFACLLPDTNLSSAQNLAEQLRLKIMDLNIEHKEYKEGVVTVSLGVATINTIKENNSMEALMEMADKALYRAKEAGRNQVAIEEI